jgi:16S rRNA (guanine(966)-N(2))-methyltransferase RsmD
MRIISGQYRGRNIIPPKNFNAHPTTDFAKEAIFNIIETNIDIEEAYVLDIFAGTGSISYEFASRGCAEIDSVEMNYNHYSFIKKTVQELKFSQLHCYKQNAFKYLNSCSKQYDLIFADPPYDLDGIEKLHSAIFERKLLKPKGWFILEHSKNKDFKMLPYFYEHRYYGSVNFSIFRYTE